MATKKKLLEAAAGSGGSEPGFDVDEVFNSYLYTGNGNNTQTITNDIDLLNEGGLVWQKGRASAYDHQLTDTERGDSKTLTTVSGTGEATRNSVVNFYSTGFQVGNESDTNANAEAYVAWTFRKAPKYFDVVTYSGDGTSGRAISHNLGSAPGCIIVKYVSGSTSYPDWWVYHRGLSTPETTRIKLNGIGTETTGTGAWGNTNPTDSVFYVGAGSGAITNESSVNYVAYLFAHNNGDGDFGPTGDQDIIKCGSYTTDASADATIDLGFEPQWVMFRPYDDTSNWKILDNKRGFVLEPNSTYGYNREVSANLSNAEANNDNLEITSTGFNHVNGFASKNFIYIAIRKGPLNPPDSATDVFDVNTYANNSNSNIYDNGFNADMNINTDYNANEGNYLIDRLRFGSYLTTSNTGPSNTGTTSWWNNLGNNILDLKTAWWTTTNTVVAWTWKRAPEFFDIVGYTGNGTSGRTVTHNLGVAPEMMWVKKNSAGDDWFVYVSALGNTNKLELNSTSASGSAAVGGNQLWNSTTPTDSVFTLSDNVRVNESGARFVAYLFASVDGISKVGTFTLSGSSYVDVDCGFSSGARLVIIKRHDGISDWELYDTVRGITSGDDPYIPLNRAAAQSSGPNLNPLSSGFSVNAANFSAGDYIFYAIA